MKIIFFGTPEFTKPILEELYQQKIEILAVVTAPDKVVGRKKILTPPPLKIFAKKLNLKVLQPEDQQELIVSLKDLKADFFIVVAYGLILPQEVLQMPKHAALNVHFSLLPKYRGASPIQESLLKGDRETGISIIKMDKQLDHGDIYLIRRAQITENDDLTSLTEKLANLSAKILTPLIYDIAEKKLSPIQQDDSKASYCHKISKKDGQLNFNKTAIEIKNMIRAYTPWPNVYTKIKNKNLKILTTEISDEKIPAGKFIVENQSLKIGTKKGTLLPTIVQLEGKKAMNIKNFINGNKLLFEK